VRAYDPVASQEELHIFSGETTGIEFVGTPRKVLQGAEVLAIVSEWKDFRAPDCAALFDGRNLCDIVVRIASGHSSSLRQLV
jgi:UDPglucose 6-dehydrogenase